MRTKSPIKTLALAAALLALSGCATLGLNRGTEPPDPQVYDRTGPAGDFPVVIGPAYTVDGVTYTPEDTLNYDEVGYAIADDTMAQGVTASHHTLPLPSYVEVTELREGRTILVRVERRGPMESNRLLALSPASMTQLGVTSTTPVRVRRVNPPESERALLRTDEPASARIPTPDGLLTVLRRDLPEATAAASIRPETVPPAITPTPAPAPTATASPAPTPTPTTAPSPAAATGLFVQAGAYSTQARADRVAEQLDARVFRAGNLWRVRSGPFATMADANRDLARIRSAGFRDARVVRED